MGIEVDIAVMSPFDTADQLSLPVQTLGAKLLNPPINFGKVIAFI